MGVYDFREMLAFSQRPDVQDGIFTAIREQFPGVLAIHPAHTANDKRGIDYFLEFPRGRMWTVDVKARAKDYEAIGQPGLCLEVWSNIETRKPGWSLDNEKLCDSVLFYWHDTGRAYSIMANQLRLLVESNSTQWLSQYGARFQDTPTDNGGYRSMSLFMWTRDLEAARYVRFCNARKAPRSLIPNNRRDSNARQTTC